ncbi:MAG: zf-HC2 domain-containing protein [Chloroflexi bacterium]|nr:zf-HC2 domain-containing protein [Chloroflexota bacterium]
MAERHPAERERTRLSAYRDGELDLAERQEVAAHLRTCAACQRVLCDYTHLGNALREQVPVAPLAAMRVDLRLRLHVPRRQPWPVRLLPRLGATASALLALLAVATLGGLPMGQPLGPFGAQLGVPVTASLRLPLPGLAQPAATQPSRSAASARCAQPLPGVAAATAQRPEVQAALGCATDAPRVLGLVSQPFERGTLLRRSDTREVYALTSDGRWRQYADPGPSPQPVSLSLGGDPAELSVWFWRVWSERPDLPPLLGRVAGSHQQFQGLVQTYERGAALWDASGLMYVLVDSGQSLFYADQRGGQPGRGEAPPPRPTLEAVRPSAGVPI